MKELKPRSKIAKALADLSAIQNEKPNVSAVARSRGVKPRTLHSAWKKVLSLRGSSSDENNQLAMNRAMHLVEARGASSNRLLTDKQEAAVVAALRKRFPNGFSDQTIVRLCVELFTQLRNHPRSWSRRFIHAFKHRHGIRSARFVTHPRKLEDPKVTFDQDVLDACFFLEDTERLAATIPPHMFINVDETPAYVRNLPSHALHFIDSPYPWAWVRAKERDKVTVIGACTGDGMMLQSGIIAKGTTTRCEARYRSQIGNLAFMQHTESGVTNTSSFIAFIEAVIVPYIKDQHAALIVDAYKAHLTPKVRKYCCEKHIHLLVVPDRGTDELQPLDVAIFGLAKLDIYRAARKRVLELICDEEDRWQSTAECVKALSLVSDRAVQHGWKQVFPFWEDFLRLNNMLTTEHD
jgi:DDE superfamily endonuclease